MIKIPNRKYFPLDCQPSMVKARFTDLWRLLRESEAHEEIELTHQTLEFDTSNFQWCVWGRFGESSYVKTIEGDVINSYQSTLERAFYQAEWQQVMRFVIEADLKFDKYPEI
jgi:NADPH-dependent glutamate synthase beta subunit-like oxidoreductase